MEIEPLLASIRDRQGLKAGSLPPSTDDLDLTTLPARLDDAMLARVQDIANSSLPPLAPCGERHLSQCLRIMLSVLPRQGADDLSGELFVAAYQRKLGHLPDAAISFLTDKAMERCRWFPTIAECLDIVSEWARDDEHTRRRKLAFDLASRERHARQQEESSARWGWHARNRDHIPQAEIDAMSPTMVRIGLACGALVKSESGEIRSYYVDADDTDDEPIDENKF